MTKANPLDKGHITEECLRMYFLRAGYYAIRSVPFSYEGFEITDIDVWLYGRASSVSREITIVDSKNKRTPQAIERIFWIHGLQRATKANNAVVATTERRREVKDFGRELNILVLDGSFLTKLTKTEDLSRRLSEEEFGAMIKSYELSKLDGDWRGRMYHSKSLLAKGISFDSCNEWIRQARFFIEQALTKPTQRMTALRCVYQICSYMAVGLDFSLKEISFLEQGERVEHIKNGFTFGKKGAGGMQKVIDVAMGLVEQHVAEGATISRQVRTNIERELTALPTHILGEYFARNEVGRGLFSVAREFEELAMKRHFTPLEEASIELRSFVACLLDYWGVDRAAFAELAMVRNVEQKKPAQAPLQEGNLL